VSNITIHGERNLPVRLLACNAIKIFLIAINKRHIIKLPIWYTTLFYSRKYKIAADTFSFPSETVVIEKKKDRFYQSLYTNGNLMRTHSFDVVFGSGEKAETFAYWQENQLYQLPLSFFSEISGWANSPGFPANRAHFDKAIVRRCFECHGSYIEKEAGQTRQFISKRKLSTAVQSFMELIVNDVMGQPQGMLIII
jgi:hypothetical protein